MIRFKIFPSITTTKDSDWKKQIKETKKLGLKEICLFLTGLNKKNRKELYQLLKKTKIRKIPAVHLRHDMELQELDYLVKNYRVKVFNIHSPSWYPMINDFSKYKRKIYIENSLFSLNEKDIKNFAGICIDFSHLEDVRLGYSKIFKHNFRLIKKYPCGLAHISAIKKNPVYHRIYHKKYYSSHHLDELSELNYLKRYKKYFPPIIAIELVNSIKEQLQIKEYILRLLK